MIGKKKYFLLGVLGVALTITLIYIFYSHRSPQLINETEIPILGMKDTHKIKNSCFTLGRLDDNSDYFSFRGKNYYIRDLPLNLKFSYSQIFYDKDLKDSFYSNLALELMISTKEMQTQDFYSIAEINTNLNETSAVSEEEISAYYQKEISSFKNLSFKEAKPAIRDFLRNSLVDAQKQRLLKEIKDNNLLQIHSEASCPPMLDLSSLSFVYTEPSEGKNELVFMGDIFCPPCRQAIQEIFNFLGGDDKNTSVKIFLPVYRLDSISFALYKRLSCLLSEDLNKPLALSHAFRLPLQFHLDLQQINLYLENVMKNTFKISDHSSYQECLRTNEVRNRAIMSLRQTHNFMLEEGKLYLIFNGELFAFTQEISSLKQFRSLFQ